MGQACEGAGGWEDLRGGRGCRSTSEGGWGQAGLGAVGCGPCIAEGGVSPRRGDHVRLVVVVVGVGLGVVRGGW